MCQRHTETDTHRHTDSDTEAHTEAGRNRPRDSRERCKPALTLMMETRNWRCSCWVSGWDRSRSRRRSRWPSIDCRRFLPTSLPVAETCRTCPICSDVGSFRTCPPSSAQALCAGAAEVRGCRWREGTIERGKSPPLSPLSVSFLLSACLFFDAPPTEVRGHPQRLTGHVYRPR